MLPNAIMIIHMYVYTPKKVSHHYIYDSIEENILKNNIVL